MNYKSKYNNMNINCQSKYYINTNYESKYNYRN